MTITICPESEADLDAIWLLTKAAFDGRPYAGGDEQDLVNSLRACGGLCVSLVATDGDEIVGQITFSPATISSNVGNWFALGPVSVIPARQWEGIGAMLIEAGMKVITEQGAWGCILTGNPLYYSRHGFEPAAEHCPDNEPKEYFMLRRVGETKPVGQFAFHEAFYAGS